uniref:Uncharacterized protein n=1 Tax=viral metagenome TaxID=1070528 RepID=A0A6M3ISF8_9ZZZZ
MKLDKFILKGKKIVAVDLMVWAEWFEKVKKERIVKQTTLPNGKWVSTVFLGVDHNFGLSGRPLLFETMVFKSNNELNEIDMDRYSTWEEAEYGHKEMVKKWKATI